MMYGLKLKAGIYIWDKVKQMTSGKDDIAPIFCQETIIWLYFVWTENYRSSFSYFAYRSPTYIKSELILHFIIPLQ